jgi:pimeloyl-ACP methyl ester carboxylesterase
VLDVDTSALGFADSDVAQFSYRGGQAPGARQLEGVPVNDYDTRDSEGDIAEAAQEFRDLLETVRITHPDVPVDVIAHSQGGLVVRAALGDDLDHLDPRLPDVDHVITLGTPHHGADLADINASLGIHPVGQLVQAGVREATDARTDPWSDAAGELSTVSSFTRSLAGRDLPDSRITAIAASGDMVVPVPRAVLDDADNVVVPLTGLHAHDELPGSPQAMREMQLALAGQRPTCTGTGDAVLGAVVATVEHQLGGAIAAGSILAGQSR